MATDPNADIDGMTLEAMKAEFVRLGDRLSTVATRRARLDRRIKALEREAAAKARLAAMSEDEKAALRDALGVKP
jgi:hypothetical protein